MMNFVHELRHGRMQKPKRGAILRLELCTKVRKRILRSFLRPVIHTIKKHPCDNSDVAASRNDVMLCIVMLLPMVAVM